MANRTDTFLDLPGIAVPGLAVEPSARERRTENRKQPKGPDPQRTANFLEAICVWQASQALIQLVANGGAG